MSEEGPQLHDRATALREAFDQSFTRAANVSATAVVDLLAITIGDERYALRLADVSGLFVDKTVTWLPSPVPELLGIAGFRGTVLPVYDLGMVLGRVKAASSRWTVTAAGAPVAFAFEAFDGFLRVAPGRIVSDDRKSAHAEHIREILDGESARPIVHVASVLARLVDRAAAGRTR